MLFLLKILESSRRVPSFFLQRKGIWTSVFHRVYLQCLEKKQGGSSGRQFFARGEEERGSCFGFTVYLGSKAEVLPEVITLPWQLILVEALLAGVTAGTRCLRFSPECTPSPFWC